MISFTLELEPVAKGRPMFSRQGHAYTPEKTRQFEKTVRILSKAFAPKEPLTGPLSLSCWFFMKPPQRRVRDLPTCKPDIDNLIKGVKDALNGLMWADDSQVCVMSAGKFYDWTGGKPRIEIRIAEVKNDFI
jgi:Holliday junction resolvase RusA-like endonuclease